MPGPATGQGLTCRRVFFFIIDAQVWLMGGYECVKVKGARHSFMQSVLSFASGTQSSDSIVIGGMELGFVSVPRHEVVLDCNLVKGVLSVGREIKRLYRRVRVSLH